MTMRQAILWFTVLSLALLLGGMFWALWPVPSAMAERWSNVPRYAHGSLVPLFSIALLWMRRSQLEQASKRPNDWGLLFIALGAATQLAGGYLFHSTIEGLALVPYTLGMILLVAGWSALTWSWPAIAFLVFMIPLLWWLENVLGPPLQEAATRLSTYVLQTLGFMAFAEGNVIQLSQARIGVVESCSGLSMLITFVALSTGAALVVKRPLLERTVLVLSSIPVALQANAARITLTGVLHETVGSHAANTFYLDLAGWLMIPFALLLYWFEIWILSQILLETGPKTPLVIGLVVRGNSSR